MFRRIYELAWSSEHAVVSGSSPTSKISTTKTHYHPFGLCFRSPASFLSNFRRCGKQMLEMLVAGRRSGMKPRSRDPRRPREGFRVGLAATGSTACSDNAVQKTGRMKKNLPRLGLIRSQRRSSVQRKNSSTVWLSALKRMRDFLSQVCQRLKGRSHFSFFTAPCERQVTR